MQLAILAAVLTALAQADNGALPPVSGLAWRLLLTAAAVFVAPAAALVGSQRLVRQISAGEGSGLSEVWQSRLQGAAIGLWLAAVAVLLFVAQWPQIVRGNWALAGWPLVDELAILAPVIAPLVLLWAILYRVERAGQVAAFCERGQKPPPAALASYLWLNVRFHLGLVLLPALVVIGGGELLAGAKIELDGTSTAWWLGLPLVMMTLLLMPLVVRRMWPTSPLPAGPLREQLLAICSSRRTRVREILLWHTGGLVANAAVVGFSRWLRYVLLTDGLIARLPPAQLAAVLRHELGHIRRRHLPLRLALLALPLAWWLSLASAWPELEPMAEQAFSAIGIPNSLLGAAIVPLTMLAYAVVAIGWYSRLLEHQADLEACTADDGQIDGQFQNDFQRALTTLIGPGREPLASRWLHPGLAARLTFLDRAATERGFASRFESRLRWIALAIIALYAAAIAVALG
jgi:Zn-dependent protease with chaperone function